MVTIEQVELLESKVSKAIDYVKRLTVDNEQLRETSARLVSENDTLCGKLDGYQKRIAELEMALQGFKKDQERIEQGIISSLERLNHFEDAIGNTVAVGETPDGVSSDTAADDAEGEEPSTVAVDQPAPASAVPPSATPVSAGIPAVSAFPGTVPSEPFIEEEGFVGETYEKRVADLPESSDSPEAEAADDEVSERETPDSGLGTSDETFGEMSGGMEIDIDGNEENDDVIEYDENGDDEFLDALKSDRPSGLGQIAAAFHENARPPSENILEKPLNGLELDIF